MSRKVKIVKNIIVWSILIVLMCFAYKFYKQNNFNEFIRSEVNLNTSKFKRDNKVKYSKSDSYEIISETENDATFYKTIKTEKNTPYKITCMAKTENVISKDSLSGVGAQIAIVGTTERSIAVSGTNDWQKIEFIFNSKNREQVDIGFRLGGYLGNCTGKAWFSDFTIEEGVTSKNKEWNFACLIFENTDVVVDGKNVKINMTDTDISDIKDTIGRFKDTCSTLSENKMIAKTDIYEIQKPVNKLTYDNEFGYYVAPEDIDENIRDIVKKNNYDHIFIIVRLGNEKYSKEIEIKDWIGLGSMDYYGIGFSNIRLPNSENSYIYKYNININNFPEEVFLHEFLHSLERSSQEYGYTIPALHDYEKYGYKNQRLEGLKKWYSDYMNKNINSVSNKIGLPSEIYELKPAKILDFEYSYKISEFQEPKNIIEEVKQLFKNLITNIKNIKIETIKKDDKKNILNNI